MRYLRALLCAAIGHGKPERLHFAGRWRDRCKRCHEYRDGGR